MSTRMRNNPQRVLRAAAWSAVPLIILSVSSSSPAAHVVWTGAKSSNWSDPENWSTGTVPGSADTVYLVTHDTAGNPLTNLPTNLNVTGGQLDNVIFTGSAGLTVSGNSLTLDRLATRSTRSLTYASGTNEISVSASSGGTAGLQIGMAVPGQNGIPTGATVTEIVNDTTFRISAPTTAADTSRAKNFEARAGLVWNSNLNLANAAENWTVASGQTLTVNGNISGVGSIANSYGENGGTLELKGTNSYSGRTAFNTGTLRFYGPQAISPSTTIGIAWGSARFASQTGSGDYAYSITNPFEIDQSGSSVHLAAGGRISFAGDFAERPTTGLRGLNFNMEGTGAAVAELKGNVNLDGPLSVQNPVLVRLHRPLGQAFGGNTVADASNDSSGIQGTLDLQGHNFDRKISFYNQSGLSGGGNLVNSSLQNPSTVSGPIYQLGNGTGNSDFGGPGTLIVTGSLRFSGSTGGTGFNKVGPGAAIIRSTNLLETAGNNNPNEVLNGTLVLDNTSSNNSKLSTNDSLMLGNGRLVILGNASSATTYAVSTLTLNVGSTGDRGFAEIDVRNNGGGAAFNFTTLNSSRVEPLNFQVNQGSGGAATIGSTQAAGNLQPSVTFNRNQWAAATGTAIVGVDPDLVAANAATFESSSGFTQDIDVRGSYATTALTLARTLRFTEASGNTLTLGANLELNKSGGAGSGIMVTAGTGAVTIDGAGAIDVGVNTSLSVHHNGSQPLQLNSRIIGASGAELVKTGTGELVLGHSANTIGSGNAGFVSAYIYEGTVSLGAMADTGVNSPIGTNGTVVIGSRNNVDLQTGVTTQQPARLRYTGAGHSTNRVLQLVGVSEIEAAGSGLLRFTNSGDVVSSNVTAGNWNDLILSGAGSGQFDGSLKLGHGNLVKRGGGTWTLGSSASLTTYGRLQVEEGTLVNDGSVFFHTDVLVSGNGKLAGSGTYSGAVTITSTGSISPGNSAGRMTIGNLDLGGTLVAEILGSTAGSGYDQLAVAGTVTLGATSNLQLSADYLPDDGSAYVLISNDGSEAIVGTFATANGLAIVDSQFAASGYTWRLDYAGGDGNDLVAIVTVPEPGLLTIAGCLGGLVLRRRRQA